MNRQPEMDGQMTLQLVGGRCDGRSVSLADGDFRFVTLPYLTGRTVWRPYFGNGPMVPYTEFGECRYRIDRDAGKGFFVDECVR